MLRKGVHLQLKTERTAEIIKQLLGLPLRDWRNVGLAVDDRTAADLLDRGGINYEVRTAIALGVPAITAYQMATINNAAHWQVSTATVCWRRAATRTSCWFRISRRWSSIACSPTAGWSPSGAA